MDPATLAILLGAVVASSAAGVYTNSQNIKYAQQANDESVELANTAHQREVRDLRAAGLNPILSARGSGADVPQLKTPGLENPLGDLQSSAQGIARAMNGLTKAEIAQANADATSAQHEADMLAWQRPAVMMAADTDMMASANDTISEFAKSEALTGVRDAQLYDSDGYYHISGQEAWKTYENLVQQYRNEIEQGRYLSSREHSIFNDALSTLSAFSGAASSAASVKRAWSPRRSR